MIEQLIKQIGFTENEAKLYLQLADMGKSTAQILAKRSNVPRTTVYSVLEGLVARGLVSEERKQATTFFVANPPTSLLRLVQREQEELKSKEKAIKLLVEEIKPFFKAKLFSLPRLQFFEGSAAVENMLYDFTEEWRQGILSTDGVWWGYQDHTFVERYRKWLESYWKIKTDEENIQLISNRSNVEVELKGKVKGREIRAVPAEYDFSSTIWVCGDYIILLMTRNEPHYAFQFKDSVFAANLRLVFKLIWNSLGEK